MAVSDGEMMLPFDGPKEEAKGAEPEAEPAAPPSEAEASTDEG